MELTERVEVGENNHGYRFAVGKIAGDRWIGFADSDVGAFVLPGMSEEYEMGLADRDRAIKLTGAIAQSAEHGYGGIARWFVDESLRGKPEDFTCSDQGDVPGWAGNGRCLTCGSAHRSKTSRVLTSASPCCFRRPPPCVGSRLNPCSARSDSYRRG